MAPLSGTLGYLGREQRNWARLAVLRANARSGRRFRLVEADTRLDSDTAAARAQQLAANASVLGVVGPAGSDEVEAVAPAFARAKLAYVSGSAYRASLTAGARPGFFRVIPSDASQAPTAAAYMLSVLRVKHVLVVDDRSAYSIPLADTVQRLLRAGGVNVRRDSVGQTQVDYSPVISKVNRNTDAVLLPWQNPAKAQLFGVELRARGKAATVFGTDGLFSTDFTLAGSYVTVFAPDPRRIRAAASIVRDYDRRYGSTWTPLGSPTYVAAQVVMAAVDRACRDGKAGRAEVRRFVARTRLATSFLGIPISFARSGDLRRGRFFVYRVVHGKFVFLQ